MNALTFLPSQSNRNVLCCQGDHLISPTVCVDSCDLELSLELGGQSGFWREFSVFSKASWDECFNEWGDENTLSEWWQVRILWINKIEDIKDCRRKNTILLIFPANWLGFTSTVQAWKAEKKINFFICNASKICANFLPLL